MMTQVFIAISAFFAMFTRLCSAGEKAAGAVDHLAGWAEEAAASYHTEAIHDREITLDEMTFKREQKRAELEAKRKAINTAPAKATKSIAAPAP